MNDSDNETKSEEEGDSFSQSSTTSSEEDSTVTTMEEDPKNSVVSRCRRIKRALQGHRRATPSDPRWSQPYDPTLEELTVSYLERYGIHWRHVRVLSTLKRGSD
jgi:hypothetical protein